MQNNYNQNPDFWSKREAQGGKIRSDFLCRPEILELLGDVRGKSILDIGCGEGYVSRILHAQGARMSGVDISTGMIEKAKSQGPDAINYDTGNAINLHDWISGTFDGAISVLVYCHLSRKGMDRANREVFRLLKPGGKFILALPHPFDVIAGLNSRWRDITRKPRNYWSQKSGIILKNADGEGFSITQNNHTIADIMTSVASSGLRIIQTLEPRPTPEMKQKNPSYWSGSESIIPSFLILEAIKPYISNLPTISVPIL